MHGNQDLISKFLQRKFLKKNRRCLKIDDLPSPPIGADATA
jgi:hypothetical protein